MKTLTIGFSKSSKKFGIFSWIIMWGQGTKFSHVYLKYKADWADRDIYFQASHTSVNFMNSARFLGEETVIQEFEFAVDDAKFAKMQDFCLDNSAKPYGILSVFGFAYKIILNRFGFKVHNPICNAAQTPVCSQLIAELLADLDVTIPMDIEDITPLDLFPIIEALPSDISTKQETPLK